MLEKIGNQKKGSSSIKKKKKKVVSSKNETPVQKKQEWHASCHVWNNSTKLTIKKP